MKDLFFCIKYSYYECTDIILNGGYLEFELDMICADDNEFLETQSLFYKEEDFEIEYCGVSLFVPVKNVCMFYTNNAGLLTVWVTFNVKTFVVKV